MIKLLALDLDGTCLTTDVICTDRTLKAMQEAARAGVTVVPTTGRSRSLIPESVQDLEGIRYHITSNGATVTDLKTDQAIYTRSFSHEQLDKILELLEVSDYFLEFYIDERDYVDEADYARIEEFIYEKYRSLFYDHSIPVKKEELLERIKSGHVQKINFRPLLDTSVDRDLLKELQKIEGVTLIEQIDNSFELITDDTDKGYALKFLADYLGLKDDEVMAVGDSNNDLTMLKTAGIGVAMGQAEEHMKQAAYWVSDDNDHEGVTKAIEKFILDAPTLYVNEGVDYEKFKTFLEDNDIIYNKRPKSELSPELLEKHPGDEPVLIYKDLVLVDGV